MLKAVWHCSVIESVCAVLTMAWDGAAALCRRRISSVCMSCSWSLSRLCPASSSRTCSSSTAPVLSPSWRSSSAMCRSYSLQRSSHKESASRRAAASCHRHGDEVRQGTDHIYASSCSRIIFAFYITLNIRQRSLMWQVRAGVCVNYLAVRAGGGGAGVCRLMDAAGLLSEPLILAL